MADLRIALLGPLRVWRGERELETGPAQRRAVLAALALRRGQVVPVDDLAQGIWGWDPPTSAAVALRNHVSRLRAVLEADPRRPRLLVSAAGGYALRLGEEALDTVRCERLAAQAERAGAAGDLEGGARLLGEALALWDGTALTGVPGEYAERQRHRLTERRLVLAESRLRLELELGRHAGAAAELSALAEEHPVREGLRALQMLALYRCGQQAAALAGYDRTRRHLAEELGIDPGPELSRLYQGILRSDPALAAPGEAEPAAAAVGAGGPPVRAAAEWVPPAQLPAAAPDFTGRLAHVAGLGGALRQAAGQAEQATAATVWVIHGMGGVGKTTLAVQAAQAARTLFPDGQLYADLRGASNEPADPHQVQGVFLRSLGVPPENIPGSVVERTALYRSRMAGRRLLLLLDNAAGTEQVESLMPGTAQCAVLLTSRTPLPCLPVTGRALLEPFDESEALALLGRIAGGALLEGEPQAARALVRACGLLPLAVRIAAARLASRPGWTLASLTDRLADRARILTELETGSLAVESAFQLGYASLGKATARAFRLLAIPEIAELTPEVSAAVLDTTERAAEVLLEALVDVGLLESREPGRYRYHDLVRLFARHRTLSTDSATERRAVLSRLAHHYLAGMGAALRVERPYSRLANALDPSGARQAGPARGQQWVIAELPSMLALAAQILHHPTRPVSPQDARVLGSLLVLLMPSTDLCLPWRGIKPMAQVLLRSAEEHGDRGAVVNACVVLAMAYAHTGEHELARATARRAHQDTDLDDAVFRHRMPMVRGTVAAMHPESLEEAVGHFELGRELSREAGEAGMEAQCAAGLAKAHLGLGRPEQALRHGRDALALYRASDCAAGAALALRHLGEALNALGRHAEALEQYGAALAVCEAEGLRTQQAQTLLACAVAESDGRRPERAAALAGDALVLLTELGDLPGARRARELLGLAREG
ncbi:AfsR/SARP family transcriptional regulator [Kitasatospora sp. NPDC050543]|uniref:AfsR/SARP family transcriptional regulator n=1 Tax=Kitasatospora sp. NPDC050543 TaxID=3364054 RepID=UPI00378EA52A